MNAKPACGPERDPEFFGEIEKVFAKYPEAAGRYAVRCKRLELEVLKIDFQKQVGVTRIEDGRIITEFLDRDEVLKRDSESPCCEWPANNDGTCNHLCEM
ncbi:hypothetical protein [Streptomyces sp. XH2]|uniref:hypothetical protein n=1 Tax=Streptomyces sp. XH2 TaxID=3412483 RepID=UPI003C7E3624